MKKALFAFRSLWRKAKNILLCAPCVSAVKANNYLLLLTTLNGYL
jgi:hypothetical protein